MKRTAWLLVLVFAAGLALGAARSAKKFRYLPERWNRVVRTTEMELSCLRSAFRAAEPVVLRRGVLAATEIRPEARATHLRLTVTVRRLGPADRPVPATELSSACAAAYRYWREELLRRPIPPAPECPVTIDLKEGSKTIYREVHDRTGRRGFENPPV